MTITPMTRTLAVTIVLVGAIVGGAYALGHAFSTDPPGRTPTGATAVGSRTSPAVHRNQPTPTPTTSQPDADTRYSSRPPLPPEEGGPFGSRQTTGSTNVALTFDDGPDPVYTPQILAVLRRSQVKATFCLVGTNVEEYPELVRAIVADGHTLCNHSWSHDMTLGSNSPAMIRADLTATSEAIRAAAPDARIKYFRQPGGNWTSAVVAVARELGMTSLDWAVDPRDWAVPGADSVYTTVTSETTAGDVVLLHDAGGDRQGTVTALRSILANFAQRFRLEALPTIFDPSRSLASPSYHAPGPSLNTSQN